VRSDELWQRSTFLNNLQIDVQYNSPVAGDAWEAPGGPHLPGHPVNQEIFHWFEIGGWNTNTGQVWFADSATTVWSGVPAYSVYSTYTIGTIAGSPERLALVKVSTAAKGTPGSSEIGSLLLGEVPGLTTCTR